jgi:hypothetical protein
VYPLVYAPDIPAMPAFVIPGLLMTGSAGLVLTTLLALTPSQFLPRYLLEHPAQEAFFCELTLNRLSCFAHRSNYAAQAKKHLDAGCVVVGAAPSVGYAR